MLEQLERYLKEYDAVFMASQNIKEKKEWFEKIKHCCPDRKILFIYNQEDSQEEVHIPGGEGEVYILDEEYRSIERLYYMYEFSGHIQIVEENKRFGNLGNYVRTGIMTEKEAMEAFFFVKI